MRSPAGALRLAWTTVRPFVPHPWRVGAIGSLAFASAIAESAVLVLLALTAASVFANDEELEIAWLSLTTETALLSAAVLLLVLLLLSAAGARVTEGLAKEVMQHTRETLVAGSLHARWAVRRGRSVGDLQEIAGNHVEQTTVLAVAYSGLLTAMLTAAAYALVSVAISPGAALAMTLIGAVLLFAIRPLTRRTRGLLNRYARDGKEFAVEVTEAVLIGREIELHNASDAVTARLTKRSDRAARLYGRARFYIALTPQVFQLAVLGLAVGGLALLTAMSDPGSVKSVGASAILLLRVASAGQRVVANSQAISERQPYARSVADATAWFAQAQPRWGHQEIGPIGTVAVQDLRFSYEDDAPVLDGVNFTISSGEALAVVGPSGAGKSTLLQLLLRLREPEGGAILVDGTPIADISPRSWSQQVAFVPQDPVLLNGTVTENVRFFRDIPDDAVRQALSAAHVLGEMESLPSGLDTVLGRASTVSGGQLQRLALARALAGGPSLVILDEPTAALDPISERRIHQTLNQLHREVALLIVAHRHSTIAFCDRILVLRAGAQEAWAPPGGLKSTYFDEAFSKVDPQSAG